HVSKRIHGNASHPAMNPIREPRRISSLLENNRAAVGIAQLPPANTSHFSIWPCAGRDRLISNQRLVTAEIAIGKPEYRPLSVPLMKKWLVFAGGSCAIPT